MSFLITLLAFALAGYATLRMRPKNPVTAVLTLLGYVLTFLVILLLLQTVLPRFFLNALPGFQSNWQPVWQEAAGAGNQAVTAVNGWLNLGVPEITVVDTIPDTVPTTTPDTHTHPTNPLAPPDTTTALSPTLPITPTHTTNPLTIATSNPHSARPNPQSLTETQKVPLYNALAVARNQNDRLTAETAVSQLLALDPVDPVALETELQMQTADQRIAAYAVLSNLTPQLRKRTDWQQQVYATLRGGRYHVTQDGAKLTNFACQELATLIDETPGFTYGSTFTVPRCYLEPWGATTAGTRFAVP